MRYFRAIATLCVMVIVGNSQIIRAQQETTIWVTWSDGDNTSNSRTYLLSGATLVDIWETTRAAQWRIIDNQAGSTFVQVSGDAIEGITTFTPLVPCWRVTLWSDDPHIAQTWQPSDITCYSSFLSFVNR